MRFLKLTLAVVAVVFGAVAQNPKEEIPTIKVDVDIVNILCSVRDRNGALIPSLGKDDFVVKDEGQTQDIRYFARQTDLPLTIGLLVDVSLSQKNLIETEKITAAQFFSKVLGKKDMAFLISFGSEVELLQDFTNSMTLLRDGLDRLRVRGAVGGLGPGPVPTASQPRGTALFDSVYLAAAEKLRGEVGRKAVVLITDGVDVGSRLKRHDALEAAHKADVVIYSIYYVDPGAYYGTGGSFFSPGDSDLKRMSEETGGRLFRVSKKNPLDDIFRQIQDEMRSQYSIGYSPSSSAKNGAYRRVDVSTKQKDLKVQARKGYYAATSGS